MTVVPAEFVDFGARKHEIAAISQDNWPHAFARSRLPGRDFIHAFHCNHIHGVYGDCSRNSGSVHVLGVECEVLGDDLFIGLDFGTESVRAPSLVDVATGAVIGDGSSRAYGMASSTNGCPGTRRPLGAEWALQNPADWLDRLEASVREALADSRSSAADVVGLGIDFTACTVLPTTRTARPLCQMPSSRVEPHAWPKLWKHHAAQPEADRVTELAATRNEPWLRATAAAFRRSGSCPRRSRSSRGARGVCGGGPHRRGGRLDRVAAHGRWPAMPAPPATRASGASARATRDAPTSARSIPRFEDFVDSRRSR